MQRSKAAVMAVRKLSIPIGAECCRAAASRERDRRLVTVLGLRPRPSRLFLYVIVAVSGPAAAAAFKATQSILGPFLVFHNTISGGSRSFVATTNRQCHSRQRRASMALCLARNATADTAVPTAGLTSSGATNG